jgi:hypothetical protein
MTKNLFVNHAIDPLHTSSVKRLRVQKYLMPYSNDCKIQHQLFKCDTCNCRYGLPSASSITG